MYQPLDEVASVLGRRYPKFVYGGDLSVELNGMPIFVYHDIEPILFERQLEYLSENNINTVTCDEYNFWLKRKAELPSNSVMLMFDDGKQSVWQYAYPLLKKYSAKANVFVLPGYTKNREKYHPNLADLWSGAYTLSDLEKRSGNYYNLMYWEEINEIQESGVIDVHSHSLYHHRSFSDDEIVGFFNPTEAGEFFDWVIPSGFENIINSGEIEDYIGFPVYKSDSLFRSMRKVIDNEDLRSKIVEYTKQLGGAEFFKNSKNPQSILQKKLVSLKRNNDYKSTKLSEESVENTVLTDLVNSKEMIEKYLGKTVDHFCYPYSLYSEQSIALTKKAGYKTNFIGTHVSRRSNMQGDDPFKSVRLNQDYFFTLPGRNRKTLFNILQSKFKRLINK